MKTKIIRDEELNRLADACCRAFEVNIEDFFSRCKRANIADARKAYYHIIKSFYEMNEYEISFNVPLMRHRTTIMFAVDAASDLLEFDEPFRVRLVRHINFLLVSTAHMIN